MPNAIAIDDLIARNSKVIGSDQSATDKLLAVLGSYFSNHGALTRAEKISSQIDRLPDDVDERPVIADIAKRLKAAGLVGQHADPKSSEFYDYFHSPKRKVIDQVIQLALKGTDTLSMAIKKAEAQVGQETKAVFDMVDCFVADAPNQEAFAFLREVGTVLYKGRHVKSKATYTTLGRAELFYRGELETGIVDQTFNNAFIRFARGCTKADISPGSRSESAAYAYLYQERSLTSLVAALRDGGYEAFVAFRDELEIKFGPLRREYLALTPTTRELIDLGKGITPIIPPKIQNTLFGEMCLKVATQYITKG